jgi:OmpA-OmpF porin, OOP family
MKIKNSSQDLSFDPGFRGDVTFGYRPAPPVSVEFETGIIWNQARTNNALLLAATGGRVDLYQVPFLANLVVRTPSLCGFSAYFGGGFGGVASTLEASQFEEQGEFEFRRHTSDSDFTYAYQGMAGLKYSITANMDVDVGYKFLGTGDHSWFGGDPNLSTQTKPAYSHSILASFTWNF